MTSTITRRVVGASLSPDTTATSRKGRTDRSSRTPGSPKTKTDWASIKLPRPLVVWIKQKAATRGVFMAVLVEEMITKAIGGSQPWKTR